MAKFARQLGKPYKEYDVLADRTLIKFSRFWNADTSYCYDVLDSPDGDDASLRPNQIFAVSLPGIGAKGYAHLRKFTEQLQNGGVITRYRREGLCTAADT